MSPFEPAPTESAPDSEHKTTEQSSSFEASFSRLESPEFSRHRSWLGTLLAVGILGGLGAGGYYAWPHLTGSADSPERDKGWLTETVSRGRLLISVTEDGNVESASNVDIKCEVTGGSTILWIVSDGTQVEAGQEIVRLDQALISEELNAQKILYEKALALKIQAEQDFEAARIAVTEYQEGTFVKELQVLETTVTIAEENLRSAQNMLDHTKRMFRKGFVTALQAEADQFAVKRSELELASAKTARDVLVKFTKDKMIKELEAARDAAAARMRSEQAATDLEKAKLDRLILQKENCIITAPQSGMIIYANERGRRGNNDTQIEEGTAVREGQSIVMLPDLSHMQVLVKIHESKIEQIRSGAPARITIQGRTYDGKVVSVANQPESKSWFSSDVKEYACTVAIEGETRKLKPGMTAEVEIFVVDLHDELTVPVSAVVEQRGKFFVWALENGEPSRRPVLLGPTNDKVVAIRDGVAEGDEVFLNPRAVLEDARMDSEVEAVARVVPDGIPNQLEPQEATPPAPSSATQVAGEGKPTTGGFATASLADLDKDGDGKLSKAEAPERMAAFFDNVDTDKDGFVGATEWAEMRKRAAQFQQVRQTGGGE